MTGHVMEVLNALGQGVEELEKQLAGLGQVFGGVTQKKVRRARWKTGRKSVNRSAGSSKRIIAGKYSGSVRWLNAEDKARVKKVKETKGLHAAIKLAKSLNR